MENIAVCVRIRPRPHSKDEDNLWKVDKNTIMSVKSKEYFTFGKINFIYIT
jgi:hypothetical protein